MFHEIKWYYLMENVIIRGLDAGKLWNQEQWQCIYITPQFYINESIKGKLLRI